MIEPMSGLPESVLGFVGTGRVTARDYESVLMPAVESELKKRHKLRLLYQLGPGLTGFTAGAMWDDAKVGLEHLGAWEKVAVVSDVDWIRHAVGLFGFAMPCPVRVFTLEELAEARDWIAA